MSLKLDTTLRVRTTEELKKRVERVADIRGCDSSDVVREAILLKMNEEEERLNLPEISTRRSKKQGAVK